MSVLRLRIIVILLISCVVAHDSFSKSISLATAQTKQAAQYGVVTKPLTELQEGQGPTKFTQTEAHLQVKTVRDIMSSEDSARFIPYLDLVSDCLAKEAELKNTHYVFYHTTENAWRVAQDLQTQLSAYYGLGKQQQTDSTFIPLRPGSTFQSIGAKEFLINELKENGLVDDRGDIGAYLLSVNLSLFGNIGYEPECSWAYFLREKVHRIPDSDTYKAILKQFNRPEKYIDELLALPKLFETPQKTILQIFVPKQIVDDIGYLARPLGSPAHPELEKWAQELKVKKKVKGEKLQKGQYAIDWLATNFKQEQKKNPYFNELLKSVESGQYSLDAYLKMYCRAPWDISTINSTQARLIFTPEVLMNPNSGVQIYRHSTAGKKKLQEYSDRLKTIVDKIISEK